LDLNYLVFALELFLYFCISVEFEQQGVLLSSNQNKADGYKIQITTQQTSLHYAETCSFISQTQSAKLTLLLA